MFIELHIIQNFAPSNLNRSDTGSPKDCEFGGVRRARVSSQCLKRAIRRESTFQKLLEETGSGVRTRRLILEISQCLSGQEKPPETTVKIISEVFKEGGIERPEVKRGEEEERDNTRLILFMDKQAIGEMTERFRASWETLAGKDKNAKNKLIKELGDILAKSVKSPDIALFGRMVEIKGDKPFGKLQLGVDAACQVAHAISTHKSGIEFDFYTAVDDLLPTGETGAGMMGTIEFNSACFYRYANVDMEQLKKNLSGKNDVALNTLKSFIRASIEAIPTGKQNSMAAQNLPSFVLAVVRESGLWSLANAFVKPVRPTTESDVVETSIRRLDQYWQQLTTIYGDEHIREKAYINLSGEDLPNLNRARVDGVKKLIEKISMAVSCQLEGQTR